MRYCPYCHRFNPGRPEICHFCRRTWWVRLCPRGHDNPYNAQYCGTCGSTDLTETAGRAPWLILTLKASAWLLLVSVVYEVIMSLSTFLRDSNGGCLVSQLIVIILLFVGVSYVFSRLPSPIKQVGRTTGRYALKGLWFIVRGVLLLIWKVLR
jgi:hypothetical protein